MEAVAAPEHEGPVRGRGVDAHRRAAARAVAEGRIAAGGAPRAREHVGRLRGVRPQREGLDAVEEGQQRRRRPLGAGDGAPEDPRGLPRVLFAPEGGLRPLDGLVVGRIGSFRRRRGVPGHRCPRRRGHGDGGRGLGRGAVALRARPQIRRQCRVIQGVAERRRRGARVAARQRRAADGERRRRVRRRRRRRAHGVVRAVRRGFMVALREETA